MKKIELIRKRFLKDPIPIRIGGLASNLARIASFSKNQSNRKAIEYLLEESKFFIEWLAPEVSIDIQSFLVEIQIKLSLLQRSWTKQSENSHIINQLNQDAKHWSDYLIKTSGLLKYV